MTVRLDVPVGELSNNKGGTGILKTLAASTAETNVEKPSSSLSILPRGRRRLRPIPLI